MKKQIEKNMWELFLKNNLFFSSKLDKRKREIKFLLKKYTEKELWKVLEKRYIRSHYKWYNKDYEQINWKN